ncbi:MAG: EpsI family protein [Verrucomicrobia bacterium]|nr:EpsI family protein [Verrucomicrobiota bacterium]
METSAYKPYIVVIALMVLTSLALAFTVDVKVTDEAGVRVFFPDKVGNWIGHEQRFCQNKNCRSFFDVEEMADPDVCPKCGEETSRMTIAEKAVLPEDTQLLKKKYVSPEGKIVYASIVMSGKERSSIHRPQMCLVGQGNEITDQSVLPVEIEGRKPLNVMVLDMLRHMKGQDGKAVDFNRYYAYWFVGKGRETPYHIQRMIWMSTDRIFHNVSHRWAYISVSGDRDEGGEKYLTEIQSFIHDLYPEMVIN